MADSLPVGCWAVGEDLPAAGLQFAFWANWQREQVEQGIQRGLLAQLLQVDPVHLLVQENLKGLGGAELEAVVRRDHQHGPVLNPGVLLQKAIGLRRQPVVEALVGVHLHLQQHHRELGAAGFSAAGGLARPEHTIEAVAQFLDLEGFKTVELIAGRTWVEAQCVCASV